DQHLKLPRLPLTQVIHNANDRQAERVTHLAQIKALQDELEVEQLTEPLLNHVLDATNGTGELHVLIAHHVPIASVLLVLEVGLRNLERRENLLLEVFEVSQIAQGKVPLEHL